METNKPPKVIKKNSLKVYNGFSLEYNDVNLWGKYILFHIMLLCVWRKKQCPNDANFDSISISEYWWLIVWLERIFFQKILKSQYRLIFVIATICDLLVLYFLQITQGVYVKGVSKALLLVSRGGLLSLQLSMNLMADSRTTWYHWQSSFSIEV